MAATVLAGPTSLKWVGQSFLTVTRLATLESGVAVDVAHGWGDGEVKAKRVTFVEVEEPDDGSAVSMSWVEADDNLTNGTCSLIFKVPAGDSITGAVVDVYFEFSAAANAAVDT